MALREDGKQSIGDRREEREIVKGGLREDKAVRGEKVMSGPKEFEKAIYCFINLLLKLEMELPYVPTCKGSSMTSQVAK